MRKSVWSEGDGCLLASGKFAVYLETPSGDSFLLPEAAFFHHKHSVCRALFQDTLGISRQEYLEILENKVEGIRLEFQEYEDGFVNLFVTFRDAATWDRFKDVRIETKLGGFCGPQKHADLHSTLGDTAGFCSNEQDPVTQQSWLEAAKENNLDIVTVWPPRVQQGTCIDRCSFLEALEATAKIDDRDYEKKYFRSPVGNMWLDQAARDTLAAGDEVMFEIVPVTFHHVWQQFESNGELLNIYTLRPKRDLDQATRTRRERTLAWRRLRLPCGRKVMGTCLNKDQPSEMYGNNTNVAADPRDLIRVVVVQRDESKEEEKEEEREEEKTECVVYNVDGLANTLTHGQTYQVLDFFGKKILIDEETVDVIRRARELNIATLVLEEPSDSSPSDLSPSYLSPQASDLSPPLYEYTRWTEHRK